MHHPFFDDASTTLLENTLVNLPLYIYFDVLIFSSAPEKTSLLMKTIVNILHNGNMKISDEEAHFFQEKVEHLGHTIKHNRITVDPKK